MNNINKELLKVVKSITVSDLGDSVLNPYQFDVYQQMLVEDSNVLEEIRFQEMPERTVAIDSIGFGGGQLTKIKSDGFASNSDAKPNFKTNELKSVEAGFDVAFNDSTLTVSIAKGNLENTLMTSASNITKADLEKIAFSGDTGSNDETLSLTDGWVKLAGNKSNVEYDVNDVESITKAFDKAIEKLPKKFMKKPEDLRFYVSYNTYKRYRDYLKSRGTALGDIAHTDGVLPAYEGIPVKLAFGLNSDDEGKENILLTHPNNTVWGLYKNIGFETQRSGRKTVLLVTVYPAFNYEDEKGASVVTVTDVEGTVPEGE